MDSWIGKNELKWNYSKANNYIQFVYSIFDVLSYA